MGTTPEAAISPQQRIEEEIQKIVNLGNFEGAFLFSSEGLPLAQVKGWSQWTAEDALEVVVALQETVQRVGEKEDFSGVREVTFWSSTRKKLIVRFFEAFNQIVSLVLIVAPGKTYRSHANRLIRNIREIAQL